MMHNSGSIPITFTYKNKKYYFAMYVRDDDTIAVGYFELKFYHKEKTGFKSERHTPVFYEEVDSVTDAIYQTQKRLESMRRYDRDIDIEEAENLPR